MILASIRGNERLQFRFSKKLSTQYYPSDEHTKGSRQERYQNVAATATEHIKELKTDAKALEKLKIDLERTVKKHGQDKVYWNNKQIELEARFFKVK